MAIVEAAVPGGDVLELVIGDDERRRAAFVVRPPDGRLVVLKVAQDGDGARAGAEHVHLARLAALGIGNVPRAIGLGEHDGMAWSLETHVEGVPLPQTRWSWRRRYGGHVLDALARWLTDLAVATRRDDGGVLAHGDIASGENVLAQRRRFAVIDWETAVDGASLLVDLLPTIALGAGRLAGHRSPGSLATWVVDTCAGRTERSGWVFDRVDDHLRAFGLDRGAAGDLAATAWHQDGSMRHRHAELVQASGGVAAEWTSASELVAARWAEDPDIGPTWRAFTDPPSTA